MFRGSGVRFWASSLDPSKDIVVSLKAILHPVLYETERAPVVCPGREIHDRVFAMCGLATSNFRIPPAPCTASIAVALYGDRFSGRRDQESLLRLLERTENEHAWPTRQTQITLKLAWGHDTMTERLATCSTTSQGEILDHS